MVNKAKSRGVPDRTYIAGSKKNEKKEAREKKCSNEIADQSL